MPFINGIGPFELIIILVIALIVVGPGRLPDVGAALGKSIREFRKAATDVKDATSLEPAKPEPTPSASAAPTPAIQAAPTPVVATSSAPVEPPPAPVEPPPAPVAPPAAAASPTPPEDPSVAPAPDVADMPEPVPAADVQPTRSA